MASASSRTQSPGTSRQGFPRGEAARAAGEPAGAGEPAAAARGGCADPSGACRGRGRLREQGLGNGPASGRSTSRTGLRSSNISTSFGRASSFRRRVLGGLRALLLAEQPAARHRQRAAAGQPDADHLRRRRAVHDDRDDRRLRRHRDLAAGDPLPGLRLRPAGADHPREARRRPLPDGGPASCSSPASSSATSSSCPPRPSSSSTSTRTSSTSRSGRRTTTASSRSPSRSWG